METSDILCRVPNPRRQHIKIPKLVTNPNLQYGCLYRSTALQSGIWTHASWATRSTGHRDGVVRFRLEDVAPKKQGRPSKDVFG